MDEVHTDELDRCEHPPAQAFFRLLYVMLRGQMIHDISAVAIRKLHRQVLTHKLGTRQ